MNTITTKHAPKVGTVYYVQAGPSGSIEMFPTKRAALRYARQCIRIFGCTYATVMQPIIYVVPQQ